MKLGTYSPCYKVNAITAAFQCSSLVRAVRSYSNIYIICLGEVLGNFSGFLLSLVWVLQRTICCAVEAEVIDVGSSGS